MPAPEALGDRVRTVLHVLYLVFNEGYTATSGGELQRVDLAEEAIRLARLAQRLLPDDAEVAGLLALLLLTHARREARTDAAGLPVPMAEQDRSRWDAAMIAEGTRILDTAMTTSQVGPYQLQAAIAAVHDQASTADATDWVQGRRGARASTNVAEQRYLLVRANRVAGAPDPGHPTT